MHLGWHYAPRVVKQVKMLIAIGLAAGAVSGGCGNPGDLLVPERKIECVPVFLCETGG